MSTLLNKNLEEALLKADPLARKNVEESLLLVAYDIIKRAVSFDPRIKPLLDVFNELRETL